MISGTFARTQQHLRRHIAEQRLPHKERLLSPGKYLGTGDGLEGHRGRDAPIAEIDASGSVPVQVACFPATVLALEIQQSAAIHAAVYTQRVAREDPHGQIQGGAAQSDPLFRPFFEERTQRGLQVEVIGGVV